MIFGDQRMRGRGIWALALLLSACASYAPVRDTPVKIGRPYTVRGVTYTPAADPAYDVLGYASWYGKESGNRSANGEKFRPKAIAGAHTTLPLPSYVEVTALDTGRTILVRLNDRGPFARGRVVDLSRGAAEQLGVRASGFAPVRVRVVDPPQRDR
jgi:rare lipoprotein A